MTHPALQPRRLGIIGSIVGLLAMMAAVLPHWVLPVMFPPPPVDQVIVDVGHRLKDRLIARAKGVAYQAPTLERSLGERLSAGFSIAATSLGVLAIIFAVVSLFFRECRLLAGVSAALGVSAIAMEVSFILIGALIVIAIIYAVMDHISLF